MKRFSLLLALALLASCQSGLLGSGSAQIELPGIYVMAGAAVDGDGTKANPFNNLARAEQHSQPGDAIYLLSANESATLNGGIALKPGQKLIGLKPDGEIGSAESPAVRLTNTTNHLDGVIALLSENNEVAGLHFVDMRNHAVHAVGANYSGASIHDNRFSGSQQSEDLTVCVLLEANVGDIRDVFVTDCVFRDGEDLAGIRVMHTGDSTGVYEFARNAFSDIGGRAYLMWSRGTSRIESRILDSVADNIGVGDRNADSIDPRLWGRSEQTMFVSNYQYNNTKQVGNRSNTGFEAFIMGESFPDEEEWCDGCKLTVEIIDCVFENTVTDGIQLTNYGSNSILDFTIRNTKVIGANPQQAGGAISLIAQNQYNTGSRSKLLVENCDIIDSGRYGFAIIDRSGEYTSTVDLGGGVLGSQGNNRIINSAEGEVLVMNANPIAMKNWWGSAAPRVSIEGDDSTASLEPMLVLDPGRNVK